jgi:hypothetical protein
VRVLSGGARATINSVSDFLVFIGTFAGLTPDFIPVDAKGIQAAFGEWLTLQKFTLHNMFTAVWQQAAA